MPNYTTSYSGNKSRPHMRRGRGSTGYQLPGARQRATRRRGAMYLNHSQGFGRRRQGFHAGGNNSRKPYAVIAVACAFLFFVASIIWYMNRSVDITLNGEPASVRINATIEQLIADQGLDETTQAGDLLAVDDSVLEREGGARYSVTLNGDAVELDALSTTSLTGGEEVTVEDGPDTYEDHDVQATTIEPTLTVSGTGAIQYVKTWGIPGRSEVWTGKVSGIVADRGVVQEVVNCEVVSSSVTPDQGSYIALTFDEGPSEYTEQIVQILEEKGVKATFFLSGDAVEANPAAAKAISDAGCELGSNSYSDTDLTELSGEELRDQITRGFDALSAATGQEVSLLRAPYAAFSEESWAEAMDLVSAVVSWNVDSGDWLLPGADQVVQDVCDSVRNGNIVLLTDNAEVGAQTVEALPALIDRLQGMGYKLVTLSELAASDKSLSEALDLSKVTMPEDAVLPTLADDASTGEGA